MQVSACHKTVASPTFSPGQVLYFRVDNQGWYRTADWFLTSEWIAPYGALSRDLKYLVTFDCGGPGTICVAAPPASQPRILSAGYGLDRASAGLWLPDSQWLVFTTSRKTPPGQWDVRLNALDLGAERVLEITRDIGSYEVSPAGNCIAFTAFEEKLDDFQFQLALLGSRGAQQVWQAPADAVAQVIWPRLDESIAWSGDGNLLAFFKYRARVIRTWDIATGRQRVYDIDLKGKGPAFAENLRWSPDGKKLYFESLARQHWVLDLVREQPRLISTAHSSILGQPLMYQWLPDNRRMIVPELDGSVILDVETGDIQRLSYPGSDKTRSIDDLFW
jgi:Tol biopolymer transport system component